MSVIFLDGFDHYSATQMNRKWTSANGGAPTPGRYDGFGWLYNNVGLTSPPAGAYVTLPTAETSLTVSFAFSFGWGNSDNPFLILQDSLHSTQVDLRVTSNGGFQLRNGSGLVLDYTGNNIFPFGYWNFLELKVACGGSSAGSWELRVNGTTYSISTDSTATGQSTLASPTASPIRNIQIQPFSTGNCNVMFDDFFVLDSGAPHNNFLGECRIQTNFPSADGSETDFVCNLHVCELKGETERRKEMRL